MSPETRRWLDELKEELRLLATPAIIFVALRIMRWIGMEETFISIVEKLDEGAALLMITCFLFTVVRKSLAKTWQ